MVSFWANGGKFWANGGKFCCVVVGSDSTISSFTKCDGVWISCCVKFIVPLRVSCVFMKFEIKLLLLVLSLTIALYVRVSVKLKSTFTPK